jgi:hypothetical protein
MRRSSCVDRILLVVATVLAVGVMRPPSAAAMLVASVPVPSTLAAGGGMGTGPPTSLDPQVRPPPSTTPNPRQG